MGAKNREIERNQPFVFALLFTQERLSKDCENFYPTVSIYSLTGPSIRYTIRTSPAYQDQF
jgi:hypothetical protein